MQHPNLHPSIRIQQLGLQALIAFVRTMAAEELVDNEIVAIYDGLPSAILSVVMHCHSNDGHIDAAINRVIDFFAKHNAAWAWVVGPLSQPEPSALAQHLLRHNLYKADEYPGMYFALETIEIKALDKIDLLITEAEAVNELHDWIIPIREAFNPTKDGGEGFRKLNATLPHGAGAVLRHYVGYLQNEPVCAGTLFLHNDLAMIHNVATRPAHQRKKYGTAIVLRALQDAKLAGAKHCFLDSSDKGKQVYLRIGFVEYCTQQLYTNRH